MAAPNPYEYDIKGAVKAIADGRPYMFPDNPDEKAKLIDALTARAASAFLDHQNRVVDRIKKAVVSETNITEREFSKTVREAAEKETAQLIQEEGSQGVDNNDANQGPEFDADAFVRDSDKKEKDRGQ